MTIAADFAQNTEPGHCARPGCTAAVPSWWQSYCTLHFAEMSVTCTRCGKYRALHDSGLCWNCRTEGKQP
jgi:hypothetical protein